MDTLTRRSHAGAMDHGSGSLIDLVKWAAVF